MLNEFDTLIARYDAINQIRTERALEAMSQYGQQLFELLPVLFHYNHPLLPGYVSGEVPHGIACFSLSLSQREFIDDICMATNCHGGIHTQESSILGLYSMGSTSSIGQCCHSDLDIWVCHSHLLDPDRLELLEHKCLLISKLAENRGVELNFFLIPDNKFRLDNRAELGGDNCGSAQHLLLLDEFYRSALRIAGKRLLWPIISGEWEPEYDGRVAALFREGVLNEAEWLDLGSLARIPAEEYFGSALWLLYKGLDSPYKAVLKILLMEAYSAEFPQTRLLSVEARDWFQQHADYSLQLDTYYMMLDKVTHYLQSIGDEKRLDLARRCFYLKVCDELGHEQSPQYGAWRREVITLLVREWGWDLQTLQHLDNRNHWKVAEVKLAYGELLDALMQSYSQLIQFARRNNISESINPEDIGVLSRKLYAAFEALPGKVQRINLKIAPDLHEPDLSLIQVPPGRINRAGWYLYKHSLRPVDLIGRAPLDYNGYVSKLIAWAYFNGLLTQQSNLHLYAQGSDLDLLNLQLFAHDLATVFPVHFAPASNLALSRPCEIRHLGIFLNLELDPTSHWEDRELEFDVDNSDVLSFGREQECLVGTVDLVYRNSWNEIRTLHFNGPDAVVEALSTILGKMHQDAQAPETVDIFCYSRHFRGLIRNQFLQLVQECIDLRLARDKQRLVKMLSLGHDRYALFLERRGVSVRKMESAIDFYRQVSSNKLERQPLPAGEATLQIPSVVDAYASDGLIQFFFEESGTDGGFNVYVLDENNQVEIYRDYSGSKDDLVQSVNRYYTLTHERFNFDNQFINFNLPQFYEVVLRNGQQQVRPYRSGPKESRAEPS
ncbi:MAG: class I adenylate cyclase [Aeromonadaceae bacterium]